MGKGTGDLNIRANVNSIIFSEIYSIEDCIYYTPTHSINSNKYSTQVTPQLEYLSDFKVECDFKSTLPHSVRLWIVNGTLSDTVSSVSASNYLLGLGFTGAKTINSYISTGSSETYGTASSFTVSTNTDYHFELIKQGTTGTAIYEDTTSWNGNLNTKSWSTFRLGLMNANNTYQTITLTNLKIKQL